VLDNAERVWEGRARAPLRALAWVPLCLLLWGLGGSTAFAQVEVTFGFEGEIVADAWNPVRVSLRDVPDAELLLDIDRGTLRSGERWLRFRAPLEGGGGQRTFEEVIFIPAWQQFAWSVRTPDRVLASGSVERRRLDPRPLHLVLSRTLGAERDLFGAEARVLEVYGPLPERASAFDGVATVVVGDTLTPPSPTALAAAAAAGSTVLLLEPTDPGRPLPASYETLFAIPLQRLGAGWLARHEREGAAALLARLPRLERRTLEAALLTPDLATPPPHPPPSTVLWALFGYALLTLVLLRYGRVPGLWSALLLAVVGSAVGFVVLRGEEVVQEGVRTLVLAGGPLAQRLEGRGVFSPARRDLTLDAERYGTLYPLDEAGPNTPSPSAAPTLTPGGLALSLGRYEVLLFARRPELEDARFYWHDERLLNTGNRTLENLFILGRGRQGALAADSSLRPELGDNLPPEVYTPLLPHLPRGSALARDGEVILVALPETP
jgi:hypothetical protein